MKENFKFDRRTVDRYIEKGHLNDKDHQSYLKNLPDDTAKAQYVQVDLYDAELGDGEKDSSSEGENDSSLGDSEEDA